LSGNAGEVRLFAKFYETKGWMRKSAQRRGCRSIPIHGVLGDSHAALLGHGVLLKGKVKATYGTGSSLMTLCDAPETGDKRVSTTIAWNLDRIQ
jgi:glycerol kinase